MEGEVISPIFNRPEIAGFIFLKAGEKYPPIEKEWEKKGHSFQEAIAYVAKGGNVGILAGKGYIGLDQDEPESFSGLVLPLSTTWETRPGRLGIWFKCNDCPPEVLGKYGKIADQAQIMLYDGRKIIEGYHPHIGEVKLERTYQVIPPSWKTLEDGQKADYRMLQEIAPSEISLDWLLSALLRSGIVFSEKAKASRLETNAQRLEGMKKDATSRHLDKIAKAREFLLGAAMRAKPGSRNDTGFWLACQLRDLGLDAGKASEYIMEYAKALANSEGESYTEKEAMNSLEQAYRREPREAPRSQTNDNADIKPEENLSTQPFCGIEELLRTFKKWLYIEEDYNIVAPMCGVEANFCPGDPDILGIIGPSGSIKTEIIRSFGETQNQFVYPVSAITEHTLVSGYKDSKDLVPKLEGRVLAIKDLTSILARKEDVRAGIFADFRELTDGYIKKEFGNGISREYKDIHSTILFVSTNVIERYYSMYSNLGQRMIFFRPKNNPQKARERALQNRGMQKEMREELQSIAMRFISSMKALIDEHGLPSTPEDIQREMGHFYDFLAIARTTIHHDYRSGEIDELPEPEFPTRIANTVSRLCEVHALFYDREEVGLEDANFGYRIILDNVPTMRWQILEAISTEWQTTSMIAKKADLPSGSARYALEELFSLKLVERLTREEKDTTSDRRSDSYRLSDRWSMVIEKLKTRIRGGSNIDESSLESPFKLFNNKMISSSNPCLQSCEEISIESELERVRLSRAEEEIYFAKIADSKIRTKTIEPNDADTLELPKNEKDCPKPLTKVNPPSEPSETPIKAEQPSTFCCICGEDICTGHSNYGGKYCISCGPKLSMIKATAKALDGNSNHPTTDQIWKELAMIGRPPIKKHLPAMLRAVGCIEEGDGWRYQEAGLGHRSNQ